MAVSPVRALLATHGISSWNRALLELGQKGRIATWAVAVLLGLVVLVPAALLFFFSGFFIAARLGDPVIVRVLGATLATLALMGGAIGRSRVLDWERARTLPLHLRTIFAAELLAGLADFLPALFALITAALLLGMAMARPPLLPLIVVPWLVAVGMLLGLRHILGGLAAQFLRRFRLALVAAAAVCALGAIVAARVPRLRPEPLQAVLDALPVTQSLHGLSDAVAGQWVPALLRQLYPLTFLVLLLVLAARTLKREAEPRAGTSATDTTRERLWSFTTPTRGIARLHWVSLMRSSIGLMGLLMPLVLLFVMRRQLAPTGPLWAVPALLSALLLVNATIHFDQFGLDGAGVKSLLLLPVRSADLLVGKTLALAVYQGSQLLLLLGVLGAMHRLSPAQALTAMCLSGCQLLVNVSIGHWSSIQFPRALPRNVFRNSTKTSPSPLLSVISLGAILIGTAVFGGTFIVLGRSAPAWQLPVMAVVLGVMMLAYWRIVLPRGARALDGNHERLVQFLG